MFHLFVIPCFLLMQSEPAELAVKSYDATLHAHYVHQFDASADSGGKVGVNMFGLELRIDSAVTDEDDVQFRFQYQQDDWDFSGTTGVGVTDPWETINTIDFATTWFHKYDEKSKVFTGGILKLSYEESASQDVLIGGTVGFIHSYSSDLTLGIGLGILQQELDDAWWFPVFVLDWKLSEELKLTSDISTRFGSRTGVELVWTPRKDWTLGAGVSYSYSRFKLDDSGFAPNGAGETTSMPLTFRATYHASPSFDLTFFGGVVYAGSLEVVNSAEVEVLSEDYDPAGAVGVFGRIRF
jgi:hypothetical protein